VYVHIYECLYHVWQENNCLNMDGNACWVALVVLFPTKLVSCRSEFPISRYCSFNFDSVLKRKENEVGTGPVPPHLVPLAVLGMLPPHAEPPALTWPKNGTSTGTNAGGTGPLGPVVPGYLCQWYRASPAGSTGPHCRHCQAARPRPRLSPARPVMSLARPSSLLAASRPLASLTRPRRLLPRVPAELARLPELLDCFADCCSLRSSGTTVLEGQ
jgi:hypothetical protein